MNPIEIPVSELKAALPGLKQVIPRKVVLPILGCVRVCRQRSGRLTLQATDLSSTATYATQLAADNDPGVLLVPGETLAQVLKGAAKDDVIQLVPDEQQPHIRHRVAGNWLEKPFPVFKDEEWPTLVNLDGEAMPLPPELPSTLKSSFAFMGDESRQSLHGAWLDVEDPQAHYVMAANGRALFTANSFTFGLKESLLVPYHRFLEWDGFQTDGAWQLRLKPKQPKQPGYLQLNSAHWTYLAQLSEANPVGWRNALPGAGQTRVRFSEDCAKGLLELLPRLPFLPDGNFRCELRFSESLSTVTGRATDHSNTVELIGLKVEGPAVALAVNRNFVLGAMKLGLRELELTDDRTPLLFRTGGRRLVVMPLRLESEATPPTAPPPANPTNEMPAPKPEPMSDPEPESPVSPTNPEPQPATPTPDPMSQTAPAKPTTTEAPSALRQAITKLEGLKENVKGILTDLNEMLKVLHVAQREQRAADREVEEVRAALEAIKKLRV